jgi:lipopolysaccharide/colanic/teichoic acid biosynthesis glycosyltransferase
VKQRNWDDLPDNMKNDYVRKYYDLLKRKRLELFAKRVFDVIVAIIVTIILLPLFILISIAIKVDSKGPVMFRQIRVTQYGKRFSIYKFRTMVNNAEKNGSQVTTNNDTRITKIGKVLRRFRLDEVPQLFNIISGDMSFVGTRPEVVKYVEKYTEEMMATLLVPAGVTSEASIHYKDEEQLLANADDADRTYVSDILPEKMLYNIRSIENYSFISDIKTMLKTIFAVIKRDKKSRNGLEDITKDKDEVKL